MKQFTQWYADKSAAHLKNENRHSRLALLNPFDMVGKILQAPHFVGDWLDCLAYQTL